MLKKNWKTLIKIALVLLSLPVVFVVSVYSGVFGHLQTKKELLNFKNAAAT
jgi:hypothetical protein